MSGRVGRGQGGRSADRAAARIRERDGRRWTVGRSVLVSGLMALSFWMLAYYIFQKL